MSQASHILVVVWFCSEVSGSGSGSGLGSGVGEGDGVGVGVGIGVGVGVGEGTIIPPPYCKAACSMVKRVAFASTVTLKFGESHLEVPLFGGASRESAAVEL